MNDTNGDTMMDTTAFSIDGRTFTCEGPLASSPAIGSYATIATDDGRSLLAQVLTNTLGPAPSDPAQRLVISSGNLLSELVDGEPTPITTPRTFASGIVSAAESDVVTRHLRSTIGSSAAIDIGEIRSIDDVPALLKASGFGRHTFLCGQSGSGKTYTLGLILEQLLLDTELRIGVIDPNSDYVALGRLREADELGLDDAEYSALSERFAPIAERIHVLGEGHDVPLRAWFGRLTVEQQTMVLALDPSRDAGEYHAFIRMVDQLDADDYTIDDVLAATRQSFDDDARRLGRRIENLGIAGLSIWASADRLGARDLLPADWRLAVADTGSLSGHREAAIASASLLEIMWERRRERRPVLLVIDEAHNVCPRHPLDDHQALATEHVIRIAGEGRKFGLYLLLSTQRPDKVHPQVISQCDNVIVMKMNSTHDIQVLAETFSYAPASLIERAPGFGLGEGLVAGKIAPDPFLFRSGSRLTVEGGTDVPATWARRRD